MENSFGEKVIAFYQDIRIEENLPDGSEVMHPHLLPEIKELSAEFYRKFYPDTGQRTFIIGINPGRFGGGVTGIPFTDPVKLENLCGINNRLKGKTELSADFIYKVIGQYGGAGQFYKRFYFTSVSPLGFTKNGLNLNYYDDKSLETFLRPFMKLWLEQQLKFGANRRRCICLGTGKNFAFLQKLNKEEYFFERIDVLEHPRFIMQYKRKHLDGYVRKHIEVLNDE